jgi:hypothetical protein
VPQVLDFVNQMGGHRPGRPTEQRLLGKDQPQKRHLEWKERT